MTEASKSPFQEMLSDSIRKRRRPTRVNGNYLLIEGLERSGFPDVAWAIRRFTLEMMYDRGGIYEYFHPQPGGKPPEAAANFGWSSTIFVEVAIQEARENKGNPLNK